MPPSPAAPQPPEAVADALRQVGLNEREILLYLSLLQIGGGAVSTLARRTKLPKSSAQYVCQQLVRKGFATVVEKGAVSIYAPEPPERLVHILDREAKQVARKRERLQTVLGSLQQLMYPDVTLPTVRFFEGREGIHAMYQQLLDLRSPICDIKEIVQAHKHYGEDVRESQRKRVALGIPNRSIVPAGNPHAATDPEMLREVRYFDGKKLPLTSNITICASHVCVVSFEQSAPVAIDIQNAAIAKDFHLLFEHFWESLEGERT